jgi:hypothetical protein
MKKGFFLLLGILWTGAIAAESDFLKNLRPEEARAAGLEKLSPEELVRLEQLVQRFKSGVAVEAEEKAAAQVRVAEELAQQKVAAAEARAAATEKAAEEKMAAEKAAVAKAAAVPASKQPSWFTALLTLNKAAEKPEKAQPLESRLIGRFSGWSGRTLFKLEDGTRWVQQNASDRYDYSPAIQSPKVKIVPAAMSGFWLRIDGVNMSVRVVPTELPGVDR